MQELTAEGRRLVADLAMRYGVSEDAVVTLLEAVNRGGGMQAQFNHPELGGMGQWQRGGMIMVGDMFNQGLKARVDGLCSELSAALGGPQIWKPIPAPQASQGANGVSLFIPGGSYGGWPPEFGAPSSSGSQNDLSYAFFPGSRRLAIRRGGELRVYDTGDHMISGVSQQQGGDQSLTFTSGYGIVRLYDLPQIPWPPATEPQAQPAPAQQPQPAPPSFLAPEPAPPSFLSPEPAPLAAPSVSTPPYDAPAAFSPPAAEPAPPAVEARKPSTASSADDIFLKLERLAELRQKGVLTEEEFSRKKAELLDLI